MERSYREHVQMVEEVVEPRKPKRVPVCPIMGFCPFAYASVTPEEAASVAYAFKLRKEPRVAVCFLGDGATSKGDVYEAMNVAGVHKLPVIFIVNNNQSRGLCQRAGGR